MKRKIILNPDIFVIHRKQPEPESPEYIASLPPDTGPTTTDVPKEKCRDDLPLWYQEPLEQQKTAAPDEPRAYCPVCADWQQMVWLPKSERARSFKTWFACAKCGCRELMFRTIKLSAYAKRKIPC